jgi:hypothetical protein
MRRERDKQIEVPEFESLEEERKYWEEKGPLAERHQGKINRPTDEQKRSSFLAVRMTGEELTRLRDVAARNGMGPSTFARFVINSAIEYQNRTPRSVTLQQIRDAFESSLPEPSRKKAEIFVKDANMGEPNNPALLTAHPDEIKEFGEFMISCLSAMLGKAGVQLIIPKDEKYK